MEKSWWLFWCCNAMGLMEIMKTMEAPESLSSDRLHNKLRVLVVCALPHLKLWHCLDYHGHCHDLHHRDDFNDDDNDDGHLHGTELDIVLLLLLSSSPPAPLLAHRVEDAVVRPEQPRSCLLSFSFSILCFFHSFVHLISTLFCHSWAGRSSSLGRILSCPSLCRRRYFLLTFVFLTMIDIILFLTVILNEFLIVMSITIILIFTISVCLGSW